MHQWVSQTSKNAQIGKRKCALLLGVTLEKIWELEEHLRVLWETPGFLRTQFENLCCMGMLTNNANLTKMIQCA